MNERRSFNLFSKIIFLIYSTESTRNELPNSVSYGFFRHLKIVIPSAVNGNSNQMNKCMFGSDFELCHVTWKHAFNDLKRH